MERIRLEEHAGRRMVVLDISGIREEGEMLAQVDQARAFFAAQPADGSLLTLTDASGALYTPKVVEAMKGLTAHNRPFVKAAAVVADSQLHRMVISTIGLVSRRKLHAFDSVAAAREWLLRQ